ncbi:phosphatase PAP2 family protein [Shewanella sp.]|uniref:phosphatase PAP2 family protein n=1 Tax=Shewanella sp. TaxID=50422 RepID=UPI003D0CE2B7
MLSPSARVFLGYWLALLLPPLIIWLSSASLFPLIELNGVVAQLAFAITMTGTRPWGLLTTVVVLTLACCLLPATKRGKLLSCVLIAVALNVVLSHLLKALFAEPRPYVEYLAQAGLLDLTQFYAFDRQGRLAILQQLQPAVLPLQLAPDILRHWQAETGYAFPSGHTLFSCSLSLSCSLCLLPHNRWLPLLLLLWAWLVGLSRLLLGMHWSQDILASAVLAGVLVMVSYIVTLRWLGKE